MFIPTLQQNLDNMRKCPRFDYCNIPKCALDYWMNERVELPEDEKCPLGRFIGGSRSKRRKGILSAEMRGISKFIWEKNRKIA